jgi:hypothetical protein
MVGEWAQNLHGHFQETQGQFGFRAALSDLKDNFGFLNKSYSG